ncbi:hypothetical protein POZ03_16835 [Bacteroides uniformis]|uniref:hypothetical protein n=1 Tax=Bacteroides uniformis TaxID=820 RepID=UPI00233EFD90|nr:hypothetical protein [Bacteroides uniformis]MDC1812127.1 hypothetical protein [Bacteroides uniformis]
MEIKHILNREKNNEGYIYFYAVDEDKFVAYELSAYILTHLYPFVTLEKKYMNEVGVEIYVAQFDADFCRKHFSGDNVLVDDDYIQVSVVQENSLRYEKWMNRFAQLRQ